MNAFDSASAILAFARTDRTLQRMAEEIHQRRYFATREEFDSLLWVTIADAMCTGARLALKELAAEQAK